MLFEQMKKTVTPLLEEILHHPFNQAISTGTLCKEKFFRYKQQDRLYLHDFHQALLLTERRLADKTLTHPFRIINTGLNIEKHINQTNQPSLLFTTKKSPVILNYTTYLLHTAYNAEPVVALSSLVPCFYIYHHLGQHFLEENKPIKNHPYDKFIQSCTTPEYISATQTIITMTEYLSLNARPPVQEKMVSAFKNSTQLELDFLHQSYYTPEFSGSKNDLLQLKPNIYKQLYKSM